MRVERWKEKKKKEKSGSCGGMRMRRNANAAMRRGMKDGMMGGDCDFMIFVFDALSWDFLNSAVFLLLFSVRGNELGSSGVKLCCCC